MVDIIKLEDLTHGEVHSRIMSLDPMFKENKVFYARKDRYRAPNISSGTGIFIETLILNTGSTYIYPLFSRTIKTTLDQILSYSSDSVLSSLTNICEELISEVEQVSKNTDAYEDNNDGEIYLQIVKLCDTIKHHLHKFITREKSFDDAAYDYSTKTEVDGENANIHVYLSLTEESDETDDDAMSKYIRDYFDKALLDLANLEQFLMHSETSQRLLEHSSDYADLTNMLLSKFKAFLSDLDSNLQSLKPAPSLNNEYLLTIQTTRQRLNETRNVLLVANKANMYTGQLRDLFETYIDASNGMNTMGNIAVLRRRLENCNYVLSHELFVGRGSSKLLEEGKMSVAYALRYFNDCELEYYSPKSYLKSSFYNLDELLEALEESDLRVYVKLTEFKDHAQKMLRRSILGEYYDTLEKLHHKKSGYRHPDVNGNITELFTAFEQGEITQDEIKAKIAKCTKDIDDLEVLLIQLQHEFEDCLAECAKIIEGE